MSSRRNTGWRHGLSRSANVGAETGTHNGKTPLGRPYVTAKLVPYLTQRDAARLGLVARDTAKTPAEKARQCARDTANGQSCWVGAPPLWLRRLLRIGRELPGVGGTAAGASGGGRRGHRHHLRRPATNRGHCVSGPGSRCRVAPNDRNKRRREGLATGRRRGRRRSRRSRSWGRPESRRRGCRTPGENRGKMGSGERGRSLACATRSPSTINVRQVHATAPPREPCKPRAMVDRSHRGLFSQRTRQPETQAVTRHGSTRATSARLPCRVPRSRWRTQRSPAGLQCSEQDYDLSKITAVILLRGTVEEGEDADNGVRAPAVAIATSDDDDDEYLASLGAAVTSHPE